MKVLALSILSVILCFGQIDQLDYLLSPGDTILIRAAHIEKIKYEIFLGRTYRILANGFITIPSIGRVRAGGITIGSLERLLVEKMKKSGGNEIEPALFIQAFKSGSGRDTKSK